MESDPEEILGPVAAELIHQTTLHNRERAIYLLQVALNDVASWPQRWVPEDGQLCTYTIRVANELDGVRVAQRMKAISPTYSQINEQEWLRENRAA